MNKYIEASNEIDWFGVDMAKPGSEFTGYFKPNALDHAVKSRMKPLDNPVVVRYTTSLKCAQSCPTGGFESK